MEELCRTEEYRANWPVIQSVLDTFEISINSQPHPTLRDIKAGLQIIVEQGKRINTLIKGRRNVGDLEALRDFCMHLVNNKRQYGDPRVQRPRLAA